MNRYSLIALVLVSAAVACGSPASDKAADGQSTLKGSVALTAYPGALDNPVVIAQTRNGSSFVAPVSREGAFSLNLPATDHYRVLLASTQRDGSYRVVSEIKWGANQAAWGSFPHAAMTIDVGSVRPVNSTTLATRSSGSGDSSHDSNSGSSSDDKSGTSSNDKSGSHDDPSSSKDDDDDDSEEEVNSCYKAGRADLPCNTRPALGQTWKLEDAFLEKGAPPKAIVNVTMDGGSWRLEELKANTPFVITQEDCDHEGNRSKGRDRLVVTWENADGSQESDHIDIRYCDGGGGSKIRSSNSSSGTGECKSGEARVCSAGTTQASKCSGGSLKPEDRDDDDASRPLPACTGGAGSTAPGTATGGTGAAGSPAGGTADPAGAPAGGTAGAGTSAGGSLGSGTGATIPGSATGGTVTVAGACVVNADCRPGLACFASQCDIVVR